MKKILLIATGGTIASQDSGHGLSPEIDADELLRYIPDAVRRYRLHTIQTFNIESPDILPAHWEKLVEVIETNYEEYDGFVVIHGTDTLAFTSSALSYLIQNSRKTIVVTGAQYPIEYEQTDGIRNLTESCIFAADSGMPGVYVVFHGKAMFGNHVKKVRSKNYDAFESVNYQNAAQIVNGEVKKQMTFTTSTKKPVFTRKIAEQIFLLKFYPGIKPEHYKFVKDNFKAVVMEGYGVAGIPVSFMPLFQEWHEKGIIMAVSTQVLYEGSDLGVYTVGKAMTDKFDVIEGREMTIEAIITKLMYLLGLHAEGGNLKEMFYEPVQMDCER